MMTRQSGERGEVPRPQPETCVSLQEYCISGHMHMRACVPVRTHPCPSPCACGTAHACASACMHMCMCRHRHYPGICTRHFFHQITASGPVATFQGLPSIMHPAGDVHNDLLSDYCKRIMICWQSHYIFPRWSSVRQQLNTQTCKITTGLLSVVITFRR